MSGLAVSVSASGRGAAVGGCTYSGPQCRATTTTSAPPALARLASARMRVGLMRFTCQGSPAGLLRPFNPYAYDSIATLVPRTSNVSTVRASAADRAEPVCRRPSASKVSSVRSIPEVPASILWLLAVLHASYPVATSAGPISGGTVKLGYPWYGPPSGASGVSRWQSARSAPDTMAFCPASSGRKSKSDADPPAFASARAWSHNGGCSSTSPVITNVTQASAAQGIADPGAAVDADAEAVTVGLGRPVLLVRPVLRPPG